LDDLAFLRLAVATVPARQIQFDSIIAHRKSPFQLVAALDKAGEPALVRQKK
jgi:hypothetical protein